MRRIYCTFGGSRYDETTALIVENAPKLGADEVRVYDDRWLLTTEFYRLNKWLWSYPTPGVQPWEKGYPEGFGWWVWRPYIIMLELERAQPGDVVLYTDADTYPIADLDVLYQQCRKEDGIVMFEEQGFSQLRTCKRDCFIIMGQDESRYHEAHHATCRFCLFEAGSYRAKQFLMEWQTYCLNPIATTRQASFIGEEMPGYERHLAEQAIMTNLAHKYGCRMFRTPCQWGEEGLDKDRDLYPHSLFHQIGQYDKPNSVNGSRFGNV